MNQAAFVLGRSPVQLGCSVSVERLRSEPRRSCRRKAKTHHCTGKLLRGLSGATDLIDSLLRELGDYEGDVGVDRATDQLWNYYSACFGPSVPQDHRCGSQLVFVCSDASALPSVSKRAAREAATAFGR